MYEPGLERFKDWVDVGAMRHDEIEPVFYR